MLQCIFTVCENLVINGSHTLPLEFLVFHADKAIDRYAGSLVRCLRVIRLSIEIHQHIVSISPDHVGLRLHLCFLFQSSLHVIHIIENHVASENLVIIQSPGVIAVQHAFALSFWFLLPGIIAESRNSLVRSESRSLLRQFLAVIRHSVKPCILRAILVHLVIYLAGNQFLVVTGILRSDLVL